jgi:hypothetical protein
MTKNPSTTRFCPMDHAVAHQPHRKWERPALKGYLGISPLIVKGSATLWGAFLFLAWRGNQATFLPEYAVTLPSLRRGNHNSGLWLDEPPRGIDQDLIRSHLACKAEGYLAC